MIWLERLLARRLPGSLGVRDGRGWSVGAATTLPVCAADREGEERRVASAPGVASRTVRCERDGSGTWAWSEVGLAALVARIAAATVDVRKNSAGSVFTRRRLNLIEGSNITLTVADDAGNNEVDITIAAAGGSGSGDVTGPAASVDSEIALFSGTTGKVLKRAGNTGLLKATAGVIATATAGTDYYKPGGTDVALADGGTGASLSDPNADRLLFWDDSAGAVDWLVPNTGLAIAGTNLNSTITQYTDEQAQDAVGTILTDSATIDFTYDDAANTITAIVPNAAITYAKIQNVSATDKVLGRSTAGAGSVEEIACTAFGRSLIDDADAATARTTLGLGNVDNTSDATKNSAVANITNKTLDSSNTISAREDRFSILDSGSGTATRFAVAGGVGPWDVTLQGVSGTVYVTGGTDVALADGGTGASLADPNADRILFWDDSAGAVDWLAPNSGDFAISTTNLLIATNATLDAPVISAHSASANSSLKLTSGTVMTTPEAGAIEYDGAQFYGTANTTSKRADDVMEHVFRLTGNGSNIGSGIADFFGANSSIDLPASSSWELEAHLYYTKNTAGTVTYTITNSAANYTNIAAKYIQSPAAGIATNAATTGAGIVTTTTAAAALPVTASLTNSTNQYAIIYATIDMNAAGNIRIRCTESAGTITPLRGSFYKIRRIPASVGSFVA